MRNNVGHNPDNGGGPVDVKEAVRTALDYVSELFVDEDISHLGLEEVEYDEAADQWQVTVGFSRPWDYPTSSLAVLSGGINGPARSYKKLTIAGDKVVSVKSRTR
jgi:hypothetical protein